MTRNYRVIDTKGSPIKAWINGGFGGKAVEP